MAAQFANLTAAITAINDKYSANNVGDAYKAFGSPYYTGNRSNFTENPKCKVRLWRVDVLFAAGAEEAADSKQIDILERKADGVCWYKHQRSFSEDVMDYFKSLVPGTARVPQIVAIQEYSGADKGSSSALVIGFLANGNVAYYIVYYNGGNLARVEVDAAQATAFKSMLR